MTLQLGIIIINVNHNHMNSKLSVHKAARFYKACRIEVLNIITRIWLTHPHSHFVVDYSHVTCILAGQNQDRPCDQSIELVLH